MDNLRTRAMLKNSCEALFQSSIHYMALIDLEGYVLEANKAALDFCGLKLEEVKDRLIWEIEPFSYSEEEVLKLKKYIQLAKESQPARYEGCLRIKGSIRYMDVNLVLVRDGNEPIDLILIEGWDITEAKELERKLKKSEQLYRILARSAPNAAFCIFDDQLRYQLIEGEIFKSLGITEENAKGKTIFEVLPEKAARSLEPFYRGALNGETNTVEYVGKQLSNHTYLITYKPIINPDGTIDSGMIVAMDIEEVKKAEQEKQMTIEELRKVNKRLQDEVSHREKAEDAIEKFAGVLSERNEELQQFAYVASHDLQEPLRMVASYVGLLERRYKDKLDTEAQEFIKYAMEGAERMKQLINDLLQYSRIGTRGKEFEPVNLEEMFPLVIQNLAVAIKESGAQITHDPLPEVLGDDSQLLRLFQNLIANAIKFRRKDETPVIHVSAVQKKKYWEICIRDNGIGIAEKDQERIFQIFQRLHTRDEYPGSGIGLAVVKKIVERHKGEIRVDSKDGKGTTFYFTLPSVDNKEALEDVQLLENSRQLN